MAPRDLIHLIRFTKIVTILGLLLASPISYSYNLDLRAIGGDSAFEKQFVEDYERAERAVGDEGSLTALLALTQRYQRPAEQAQLAVAIGMAYSQQEGLIDFPKAIEQFSKALELNLPERNLIDVLMWRGGSYEQLKLPTEAIKDYLRGLVACSYYDSSRQWPEIQAPRTPVYMNSPDPANKERLLDRRRHRERTDFLQHIPEDEILLH